MTTDRKTRDKGKQGETNVSDLDCIFRPRSIAVIGASRRKRTLGREIIHNLIEGEFNGPIFPVNVHATVVHSLKAYKNVLDIEDEVDLAIIVVPKKHVMSVVEECGKKGVKGLVVITAGFGEVDAEGQKREAELLDIVHKHNMRMIGPNCMGIINSNADIQMNATFAPTQPIPGDISFMSQSGALGVSILEMANDLKIGISMFASIGNKTDISGNDLLQYWKDNPQTRMILLYLESFGNPRKFTKIAKSISKFKPIIAVKSGRTAAGAKAASSHTGALAGLDFAADALFAECGVLRVNSVEEMFELVVALDNQPIPQGSRVAVLTNAGGPGILATDAIVNSTLKMANLADETRKALRKVLPAEASVENPVDMIASANDVAYRNALDLLLSDDNVDSVIIIFVPPITVDAMGVARTMVEITRKHPTKTALVCFMSAEKESINELRRNKLPVYLFPESAVRALSTMDKYRRWCIKQDGVVKSFAVDRQKVAGVIEVARAEDRKQLSDVEVATILDAYGFARPKSRLVSTAAEAIEFSKELDTPIVLKVVSPDILHKSDVGGVQVDLRSADEIEKAFNTMRKKLDGLKPAPKVDGFLAQEMVKGGKETVIGMSYDNSFGALIMFGLGGIYVEILKDVAFKIAPLTDIDAQEMIDSLRSSPLLKGVRGEKPVNTGMIVETLLRLSQLVTEFYEIAEIDINPFIVFEDREKCKAVDARIRLI